MENDDKNIIANVTRRKDSLKKKKTDLGNTFIPTGMPRVMLDEHLFTRVATKAPLQKQQDIRGNQLRRENMEKDYYLLGEILWGMKDYFISPSEEEIETKDFNRVDDCEIDLGSFDGLSDCRITIGKGNFCFRTGNYSATPQYERDKRRFFITCGNIIDDIIRFFYEGPDENVIETFKKIITIKIPKKLLPSSHQQMIENSGVLNISDITNITYTLLAKGVYYIDNNEFLEQRNKKEEKGSSLVKKRIPTKK